jgi:hypothetical protein
VSWKIDEIDLPSTKEKVNMRQLFLKTIMFSILSKRQELLPRIGRE